MDDQGKGCSEQSAWRKQRPMSSRGGEGTGEEEASSSALGGPEAR